MQALLVLIFFIVVFFFDYKTIIKGKRKNEIWVYGVIFVITFALFMLKSVDINVPGPTGLIRSAVNAIFHLKA